MKKKFRDRVNLLRGIFQFDKPHFKLIIHIKSSGGKNEEDDKEEQ